MLAALRYGKRTQLDPRKITEYASKKGMNIDAAKKALEPTRFQRAFSGNTYWPWAGLGIGAMALGTAKTVEGGRRAHIDSAETKKRALDQALSQGGMNLLFYGGGPGR